MKYSYFPVSKTFSSKTFFRVEKCSELKKNFKVEIFSVGIFSKNSVTRIFRIEKFQNQEKFHSQKIFHSKKKKVKNKSKNKKNFPVKKVPKKKIESRNKFSKLKNFSKSIKS